MKTYNVSLARSYIITIKAENTEKARDFTEFFLGDCPDVSTFEDKKRHNFLILEIKPTINESMDVEQV